MELPVFCCQRSKEAFPLSSAKEILSRNYILLCTSNYFQFMAHFILMATLPIIAVDLIGASREQVGLINGMYLFGSLVSRPFMGRLIDRYDKKKVLLCTFIFFLMPFISYFFVKSAWLLIGLRLIHGLVFGALSTATMTSAAGTLPREHMGEGISCFAVFMTLGMIMGPMLGLKLLEADVLYVYIASLTCAAMVFFAIIFLRGTLLQDHRIRKETETMAGWQRFFEPAAIPIGLAAGLTSFSFSAVSTFITLYADSIGQLAYAPYFYVSMAVTVFFSRPQVGKMFDRYGPNAIIQSALVIFAVGLLLLSCTKSGAVLVLAGIIVGLGNGNLFSSLQALVVTVSPVSRLGIATSTYFICFDGCAALGAISLGPVAAAFGFIIMYRIAAAVVLSDCFLYYFLYQRNHRQSPL